jgi:hypothetical protein
VSEERRPQRSNAPPDGERYWSPKGAIDVDGSATSGAPEGRRVTTGRGVAVS